MIINKTEFDKIVNASKKAPVATMAYFYLSSRGEDVVMCSNSSLAAALGVSVSTASTAIKALREEGLMRAFKVGTSYAYVINSDLKLPWKKSESDVFAEVSATVVLSKQEQGEDGADIKTFKERLADILGEEVTHCDTEEAEGVAEEATEEELDEEYEDMSSIPFDIDEIEE